MISSFTRYGLVVLVLPFLVSAVTGQGNVVVQSAPGAVLPSKRPALHPSPPGRSWVATYGGAGTEFPCTVLQTADKSLLVGGMTTSGPGGSIDGWVLRLSPLGVVRGAWAIGGSGWEQFLSGVATADGGSILVGFTDTGGWIVKLAASGAVQWQRTYPGPVQLTAIDTSPGGYYVGGNWLESTVNGNHDAWVLEIDPSGNVLWQQRHGGKGDDRLKALSATQDGLVVTVDSNSDLGQGGPGIPFFRPWLLRLDGQGGVMWEQTYDFSSGDAWNDIAALEGGGFVVAGEILAMAFARGDMWIARLDDQGDVLWDRRLGDNFGTNWLDTAAEVRPTKDGGFLLAGTTATVNAPFGDYWLVKLDGEGTHEWNRIYGGAGDDNAYAMTLAEDGGIVLAGAKLGATDALIMRLRENGTTASGCGLAGPTAPNVWTSFLAIGTPSTAPVATSVVPQTAGFGATVLPDAAAYACIPE